MILFKKWMQSWVHHLHLIYMHLDIFILYKSYLFPYYLIFMYVNWFDMAPTKIILSYWPRNWPPTRSLCSSEDHFLRFQEYKEVVYYTPQTCSRWASTHPWWSQKQQQHLKGYQSYIEISSFVSGSHRYTAFWTGGPSRLHLPQLSPDPLQTSQISLSLARHATPLLWHSPCPHRVRTQNLHKLSQVGPRFQTFHKGQGRDMRCSRIRS